MIVYYTYETRCPRCGNFLPNVPGEVIVAADEKGALHIVHRWHAPDFPVMGMAEDE